MRNSWEWDEDYLLELVNAKTKESIELDFKDSASLQTTDKKKEEISKDVSAFANSAGGTLLYGMKEDTQTHVAIGLDKGSDPSQITKEWLEQVINSNIHRRIDGIRIHQIELTNTSPGRVAYVVYVPQSTRTAHQAANNKYYKRFNFQSVPMEEYEVRDLYRRSLIPDLRIEFSLANGRITFNQDGSETEPFSLMITITNDALEPAEYAVIKVFIDAKLTIVAGQDFRVRNGFAFSIANIPHHVNLLTMNWGVPGKLPIFDTPFALSEEPIKIKTQIIEQGKLNVYLLGYELRAPRMPMKQSFALLVINNDLIEIPTQYMNGEELSAKYKELGF